MWTLFNYISGMMTLLSVCLEPVNWKHCTTDMHVWLYPEIQRGIKIWLDKDHNHLYFEERELMR